MRSNRHQPCLMVSPSQRASLATSPRPLGLRTVVMSAFFLLSAPAGGQTRDPQQAALDDFVAARMLGTKCPYLADRPGWRRARGLPNSTSGPPIGRRAGATPASSTNAYPTMAAFCPACPRHGPVRRQKRLSDLMDASGKAG